MKHKKLYGFLALFASVLIWGTSFVVLKSTLDDVGVLTVLSMRFIIASIIFLAVCKINKLKFDKATLTGGLAMGLSLTFAYIFQTYGLYYTTPGKNAFLTASYTILVPFMMWIISRKKPTVINLIAALICMTGIGLISLSDGFGNINIGDILTLISGIFYGLQIIFIDINVSKSNVTALSAVQFTVSAIICTLGALIFEPFSFAIDSLVLFKILYMGIFCTGICFFLQAWGQQYTAPNVAAVIMPLESVFGALVSILFYGEIATRNFFIGALLILIAIIIN